MSQATEDNTTPTELGSKIEKAVGEATGLSRRPGPSHVAPIPSVTKKLNSKSKAVSPTYVYEIRVDGVVRYIGKGRNRRMYSHMIEAQRTASKPGVKIANVSPHFRKMLVSAIRRRARIKEKIITADLTDDAAYALERHMIGSFHKNHPGQLWNTIDERFMDSQYLPDAWSNPVDPLYRVPRPLREITDYSTEQAVPIFLGQVSVVRRQKPARQLSRLVSGERKHETEP